MKRAFHKDKRNNSFVNGSQRTSKRSRRSIVVFGLCRLGFLIILGGYLTLFSGAAWTVALERDWGHLWAPVGYGLIASVLVFKGLKLWWNRHGGTVYRFFGL